MIYINTAQQARDNSGQRNICAACGHDGTASDPLVVATDGYRVHLSDTTNPRSRSITIGPRWFKKTYSSTGRTTTSADLPGPFGIRSSRRRGR